ncbi:MAG: outer membrane lipoprotein carrier protein LolA [Bacteroidales bacterium]|nr:outer membrane lipoprotein carrier protein LolA [Bacteroidales bacterium]
MKKFSLSLLITLVSVGNLFAQKTADDLLKQLIDKTRAMKNTKIEFVYRMINTKAGINESKPGILYVNGDAYRINLDGQLVISDGKTVWTYLEDSNEVMVSNAGADDEAITPNKLLNNYSKEYKASFVNHAQNTAKGIKTIELKPHSGKKFQKMQLGVNEDRLQLSSITLFDNGGNVFVYELNKMTTDNQIAADFFKFNPKQYPGVEEIDMR